MLTSSINVLNWPSENTTSTSAASTSTQANSKDHLKRATSWTSFNPDPPDNRLRQAVEPR